MKKHLLLILILGFLSLFISCEQQKTIWKGTIEEDLFFFDVFDPDGKYMAKVPVPANLNRNSVWKKNKLYTIDEDDDGLPVVKRYEIFWNY